MTTPTMDTGTSQNHTMGFSVLGSAAPVLAPRIGTLTFASCKMIPTPHHIPLTTRGAVSHIAHDVLRKETSINCVYAGLEDFIEKKHPAPFYDIPVVDNKSPLKRFICVPSEMPLILAPRRFPAIPCPPNNTETSIATLTSIGFQQLPAEHYIDAVHKLKPDIAIGMADIVLGRAPGVKRREKMVDRTHLFTRDALERLYEDTAIKQRSQTAYFAPILPLDNAQQSLYLEDLATEFRDRLSGLALYEPDSLEIIPDSIGHLPRLLLSEPSSPHELLRGIALGADLLTVPFVGLSSDAGIALDFSFPVSSTIQQHEGEPKTLGLDMWSSAYATDLSPLRKGCECYACRKHHRAYFNHLLCAKEMTAWTLLQIHNHHVLDQFFAGVRESIQRGTFDQDVKVFNRTYISTLPKQTGQGPRLRGYQLPAAGAYQPRRMPRVYGRLDDAMQKYVESQSSVATPDTDAEGLEKHGFAEKI